MSKVVFGPKKSKVVFNVNEDEYRERLNRLSANSKNISDFTNELESGSYINPQRRQKLKDELEQYQSDYEYLSFFSGVGEKERNQTFSDLNNLRTSLDTMQKSVEQVGGEEAYKNTVNNLAFTKKYKGKTYKELTDWIGSEAYNQSRHQGKVTEDEDKWLKNYAETIKYDEYSLDDLKKMVDAAKQKKDENAPGLLQKAVDFVALGDFNAQNSGYIDDYKAKKAAYDKKRFSDLASREDYTQNSAYTSQNRYSNFSLSKPFGDIDKIVEFINADDERKNKILAFRSTGTAGAEVNNEQLIKYSNLTDDQKANLNYIYNTQGKEQAEEYLNYISPQINEQMTANEVAKATQFADEHPILGTVRRFATNLGAGKGIVEDVLKNFKGENIDVNSPAHLDSQVTTAMSAKVGEKAGELLDWEFLGTPIGTTLYGAATSIGDMAIDILIARGFGTLAGSAEAAEKMTGKIVQGIMSSQAATNGVIEAKNRGLSDNQSVTLGAIAGATEWLTEKYSIEAFLGDPKKTALYLAKNFVAEGSEEAASDILNTLADYIVAGDKSEFVQSMKTYMAEGKDEKSAFAAAAGDLAMEMGNDFLAGALAGGVMGGYGKISDNARLGSVGKDVSLRNNAGNLIQTGLRADRESEFYNQANELVNSKSVKNSDIGRLQLAAEAYAQDKLNQNAKTALKGIVTQYLENEGSDPQLSDRLSEVVVRAYAGEKLTVNERKIVNGNNHVASVLNTLKNVAGDIRPRALGQQLTNLLEKTEKNKLVDAALKKGESNERVAAAIKELQTPNSGLANALQLSEPVVNAGLELSKIKKYKKIKNKTPSKLTTQDLKDVEVKDDGVTVNGTNLDELSFVDEKTSEAIAYAAEYGKLAQNYIDIYNMNPQQSLSEYAPAFELAYTYGRTAGATLEMAQNSPSASLLQPEQLQAAFKMGQTARALEQENQTFKRRRGKKNSGVVKLPAGVKASSLSEQQNASIRALRKISDVTGIRFELYNSKVKNGTYTEANGYYKNGTVYLDINAGKNGVFDTYTAILQTAAHELTHFISEYNAKMYGELQSFVVEHLNGFEGKSIEQRAIERMAEYDDQGVVLSFENAVEEITADACTQMLQDSKAMEQLAAENKSLFQKITEFLKELFADIKKAFKGAYLGNEAKAMQQHMDELQKIWDKALVGAVKQHNNYELVQKNKGQAKYSIVALENGNTYVQASRNVISGENIADWRKQITNFFNELLEGEKSLDIQTIDGDVLTITKDETANKARDNFKTQNGKKTRMTNDEFRVKLNAEAHIDEIAETSTGGKKRTADTKSHDFAKDGFSYRTAYFQDFDGSYYKLKLSVGNNGTVATVYNVGKINKDSLPSHTKIVAMVGSKSLGKLSNTSVPQGNTDVNTYSMQDGTKYSFRKSLENDAVFKNYESNIDSIAKSESIAQKGQHIEISSGTPNILIDKAGAQNLPMAILFDTAYLETRHSGKLVGNYHNLGSDNMKKLPVMLENPEYIIKLKNGRLNVIIDMVTAKGKNSLVSIELAQSKQIDGKFNKYNLIITAFGAKEAYLNRIINNPENTVEYKKETTAQGTDRLHTWSDGINASVSNDSVTHNGETVNTYFMPEDGKNSLRRAENSYEALGELEKLKKRNAALEQDIERLNKALKLTKQLTHGKLVSPAQVRMVAEIICKNAGSSYSSQKLAPRLEEVYNWLAAGKDVSYEAFYEKAVGIATDLAEDIRPAKVEIPYYKELTKAIRDCKIALSEQQKSEVAEIYGSYNEFRKQNMGKFTLTNKGTPLDVAWQELSKKYPGAFEQDITEPDQPLQLVEIYDAARSASYYIEQVNTSEMVQQIAADIYDKFWNVSTMHTFADKKQQEITELKQKHNAKIRELRGEFQQTVQDTKAHYNEKLKNVRNSKMQQMQQMQQHGKQVVQNLRQRQMKTAKIRQIRDRLSEFAKKLDKPTVKKHIPLELQGMVAQLLEAFSYKTKQELNISERLDRFKAKYSELETTYPRAYDENITKMLEALSTEINNRTLRKLNLKTLNKAYKVICTVSGYITDSNKLFRETRSKAITESGQKIVFEEKSRARLIRKSFEEWGITQWLMRQGLKFFKPRTLFKMVGSEELMHLYENLRAGEDVVGADCDAATERYINAFEQSGFKLKEGDEVKTLYLEKGGKQNFTVQELMFLYAATKREAYRKHLTVGGYVHEKAVKVEKHKVSIDKTPVQLTEADFVTVNNALTQKQKQFVDDLQSYLSKELAAKGNEVSRQLYKMDQYTDKNYWPIRSSKNFLPVKAKDKNTAPSTPKSRGFTKELNEKAVNPIVLGDFTSVYFEHVSEMATYHGLTLPLEDFRRVYEYHGAYETDENGLKPASGVRVAIENAWGKHVTDAIETFYRDVCGGVRVADASVENKLLGLAKKGAVLANLSVAIQQPSAIGRATALVPEKYLIKSTAMKRDYEKVKKYAPVAVLKEMGYFNISISRTLESYANSKAQAPDGVVGKVAAFVDPKNSDYRDNVFGYLPGKMDELTWCHIWNAVELMVKDTGRFNTESEAFYQECGRQFTKVITETQVYDSVFSRCELRRSKNGAVQMAVAFMDEPITSLNMLIDGVIDGTRLGGREGAKCIFKAAKAVFITGVLSAVSVSLIRAMRDDDEDKTYIEKYLGAIPANFLDSINPLGMIPYVKDLWSVYQGYDLNRMDMSALSGIVNALQDLRNENKSVGEKVKNLVVSISTLTGIPLRNILRDTEGLINTIFNSKPLSETSLAGITESMQENIHGELKSADFVNSYGKAVLNEDFEGAESKLNRMKEKAENKRKANYPNESSAEREKAVNSSMRAAFTRYYKNLYISGNEKKQKEIRMIMGRSKLYGTSGDIAKICKKWLADYEEEENKKNIF